MRTQTLADLLYESEKLVKRAYKNISSVQDLTPESRRRIRENLDSAYRGIRDSMDVVEDDDAYTVKALGRMQRAATRKVLRALKRMKRTRR